MPSSRARDQARPPGAGDQTPHPGARDQASPPLTPDQATPSPSPSGPPLFGVLVFAGLVIAGAGVRSASSIIGPVLLVITLVITVYPLSRWLVRHKVPQAIASVVALLAVYAMVLAVLGAVVWSLTRLVTSLTDYATAFTALYNNALAALDRLGLSMTLIQQGLAKVNLSTFTGLAQTLLNSVTSGVSLLALMLATVFFLVFDAVGIEDRIAVIREARPRVADALLDFAQSVRKYWVVTTVFGLIVAVIDVAALAIIGVPLAFTWGVLAFVTNYIPNLGFILGLLPPALIALLEGGVSDAVAVVVVYTLINVIIQTLIQPRFTGDAVGITGTVAFLSLIVWAYLLGVLGALLAVPATLLVKALLVDHSQSSRWVGALINSSPRPQPKSGPKGPLSRLKPQSSAQPSANS